jgi:hypothetical protein
MLAAFHRHDLWKTSAVLLRNILTELDREIDGWCVCGNGVRIGTASTRVQPSMPQQAPHPDVSVFCVAARSPIKPTIVGPPFATTGGEKLWLVFYSPEKLFAVSR